MNGLNKNDWRTIVTRAKGSKLTPVISNQLISNFFFETIPLIQSWADDIAYPLGQSSSITRLAQYLSVTQDDLAAKETYLNFHKQHLIDGIRLSNPETPKLDDLEADLYSRPFSEIAAQLGASVFSKPDTNPLLLLARLPLPVYITTSYFDLIERALEAEGKKPRTEICYWHDNLLPSVGTAADSDPLVNIRRLLETHYSLEELKILSFDLGVRYDDLPGEGLSVKAQELVLYLNRRKRLPDLIKKGELDHPEAAWDEVYGSKQALAFRGQAVEIVPSVFDQEPGYQPTLDDPLVYHLYGVENYLSSIVLTEDNYLDFMVWISQNINAIPTRVAQALADSSLLLLGYSLQDWEFRVFFRGLITRSRRPLSQLSLSIQLLPEADGQAPAATRAVQNYLERYFDQARFRIYWGDSLTFMQELWHNYKG